MTKACATAVFSNGDFVLSDRKHTNKYCIVRLGLFKYCSLCLSRFAIRKKIATKQHPDNLHGPIEPRVFTDQRPICVRPFDSIVYSSGSQPFFKSCHFRDHSNPTLLFAQTSKYFLIILNQYFLGNKYECLSFKRNKYGVQ